MNKIQEWIKQASKCRKYSKSHEIVKIRSVSSCKNRESSGLLMNGYSYDYKTGQTEMFV
jgi:hypothetical protein